ncbi:MAG: glycine cleavage system protein GcvH [Rhabdochlamydiaceae bacterium]|nr:glycine cleavage system protein GcvH [Rhabdochlamydiaceae bacterium]
MTKKYTPSHEWIQIQGREGIVGITQYAKEELGDIVYVQMPAIGKKVALGEEVVVLESTKAAADLYAPLSGEITEVNTAVQQDLTLLNTDPESQGWLFKMALTVPDEDSILLDISEYQKMIGKGPLKIIS